MKFEKDMVVDNVLGKGVYLFHIDNPAKIIFIDDLSRAKKVMKGLDKYAAATHPTQFIECWKAVTERFEKDIKTISLEHEFNGKVDVYKNLAYTDIKNGVIQFSHMEDDFTLKSYAISSNYKIVNCGYNVNRFPEYYNSYLDKTEFSFKQLNKILKVVHG